MLLSSQVIERVRADRPCPLHVCFQAGQTWVSHHPRPPSFSLSHQPSLKTHFLNSGYVFHSPHPPSAIIFTCPWLISSMVHLLFNCWVVSNYLWLHGLQHARLPYPSLSPGVCSNSCPLSCWCHPATSSCVNPSPPALNPFQCQGLFRCISSMHQVASVLEL